MQSPSDIIERWTVDDVADAHDVLDMYDELERRAAKGGA